MNDTTASADAAPSFASAARTSSSVSFSARTIAFYDGYFSAGSVFTAPSICVPECDVSQLIGEGSHVWCRLEFVFVRGKLARLSVEPITDVGPPGQ
jgi:hypothetical protein